MKHLRRLWIALIWAIGLVGGLYWALDASCVRAGAPSEVALMGDRPYTRPRARAYYVASWGSDANGCMSSGSPCRTIQAAVDKAPDWSSVLVATGVYSGVQARAGVTQVVYIGRSLTVRGGYAPDFSQYNPVSYPTVIDARGQGRGVYIDGAYTPVTLEGLTIVGGDATQQPATSGTYRGGGMYAQNAVLRILNCSLANNVAYSSTQVSQSYSAWGGGAFIYGPGPGSVISGCVFRDNRAASAGTNGYSVGGALSVSGSGNPGGLDVVGNLFEGNQAAFQGSGFGGAVGYFETCPQVMTLRDNTFANNVGSLGGVGVGGAMYSWCAGDLIGNYYLSNTASISGPGNGGALGLAASAGYLEANIFRGNTASHSGLGTGGGVYVGSAGGSIILQSNTLHNNTASRTGGGRGGAMVVLGAGIEIDMRNNTLLANAATAAQGAAPSEGGALYVGSLRNAITLTNNIVASNRAGQVGAAVYVTSTRQPNHRVRFLHSTVAGNSGSVAIVAGSSATVTLINTIVAGNSAGALRAVGANNHFSVDHTLFWANPTDVTGTYPVFGDPVFVDPGTGDFHIRMVSAAVDAGIEAGVDNDIDGDVRPQGRPDLGADEAGTRVYLPLVLRNAGS